MIVAEERCEIVARYGDAGGGAEAALEIASRAGPPSHFIDAETAELRRVAMEFRDAQQIRIMLAQREVGDRIVSEFGLYEARVRARLKKTLAAHPLGPWLKQFPGLGGANTALLVGLIADPRRFPGQTCTVGHHLPPLYENGTACPLRVPDARLESEEIGGDAKDSGVAATDTESDRSLGCPGIMLPQRRGTGVRSVWHYCGLHVEADGRAARKRKGQRASWNPAARTAVMMPEGGIAAQIVRLRVPIYRDAYEAAKERLAKRGAAEAGNDLGSERDGGRPLRPFEIDRIARTIAAKQFVGDLLVQWKEIASGGRSSD